MIEKKVYIGTLYVGENEIEECKESIKKQTFQNITHEIFSYLPNKEAHDTLYSRFMELQNEYDYFIKLDADMVFKRETIVEELLIIFENTKNLDHAVFSVHDWYSDSDIMGMHIFSNRVSWSISEEALFVDPDPKRKGQKIVCWDAPAPVADHSPNPSIEEAYMFGYHRALKVVQRDRWIKNTSQSEFQLKLLQKAWQCLLEDNDPRRLAVVLGAEKAFEVKDIHLASKHDSMLENEISKIETMAFDETVELLKKYWNGNSRYKSHVVFPKLYMLPLRVIRKIKRVIFD